MNSQLFIPTKINVGFVERKDTYTKSLAYIIYYDQKGVLRKETSWNSWRDHKIPNQELKNVPTEGFVLNKGVGGQRQSYGWNARNEYIRVYDPRGFEFEISVKNLLFILEECTSTKGKGLEGEFIYSWDGKELVLLPVECQDYKSCTEYTSLQDKKISAKELVVGGIYKTKKQVEYIYLGRYDFYTPYGYTSHGYRFDESNATDYKPKKTHVFYNERENFVPFNSLASLAQIVTDTPVDNLGELSEMFYKSKNGSPVVGVELGERLSSQDFEASRNTYRLSNFGLLHDDNLIQVYEMMQQREYQEGEWKRVDKFQITRGSRYKAYKGLLLSEYTSQYSPSNPFWKAENLLRPTQAEVLASGYQQVIVIFESGSKISLETVITD